MTEPLLLIFSVTGLFLLGLFILTMLVLKRVNTLLKTNVEMGAEELIRLHHLLRHLRSRNQGDLARANRAEPHVGTDPSEDREVSVSREFPMIGALRRQRRQY